MTCQQKLTFGSVRSTDGTRRSAVVDSRSLLAASWYSLEPWQGHPVAGPPWTLDGSTHFRVRALRGGSILQRLVVAAAAIGIVLLMILSTLQQGGMRLHLAALTAGIVLDYFAQGSRDKAWLMHLS